MLLGLSKNLKKPPAPFKQQCLTSGNPRSVLHKSSERKQKVHGALRSSLFIALTHGIELSQSSEAWPPLSKVVIVLVRVRGRRFKGTQRARDGSPALVAVDLDGVVRWCRGVIVRLVKPYVDEFIYIYSIRTGVLTLPGHELQVGLDVLPGEIAVDAIWVLQRGDVKGLGVFLSASLVIVTDDVLPHVLVVFDDERLVLLSSQCHK